MLIDVHVHACNKRHPKIAFHTGAGFATDERLIEILDRIGVDRAVLLSTVSPEGFHTHVLPEETIEICNRYPDRLIPFCNIDPRYLRNDASADFRPMLEAYKEMGCKGVGEYTPNIPFDDPRNMNLFAQVQEAGLPLTFHVAPQAGSYYGCIDEVGLPRLEKVLRAFPQLIFLGHSQPFWAEISTDVIQGGQRARYPTGPVTPGRVVELMRSYPNLHGDLSAGSGFGAMSRDPEFGYRFLEEFQDRLYWGTDIARMPPDVCIEDYVKNKWRIVGYFKALKVDRLISREAYDKITWRNANRLLKLGLE